MDENERRDLVITIVANIAELPEKKKREARDLLNDIGSGDRFAQALIRFIDRELEKAPEVFQH